MLALLAALLIQETAADFLKKVEEKYAAAKTFSVKVELTAANIVKGKEVPLAQAKGGFQSKGVGQVRFEWAMGLSDIKVPPLTFISDGRKLAVSSDGKEAQRKDQKLPLGAWTRRFLIRSGMMGPFDTIYGRVFEVEDLKLEELFKVTEVSDGGKEKVGEVECRHIDFTVPEPPPGKSTLKQRLWIDPSKLIVLKREMKSDKSILRETYSETTFDAEIADDVFKVPFKFP